MFTNNKTPGYLGNKFICNMVVYLLSKKYNTGSQYEKDEGEWPAVLGGQYKYDGFPKLGIYFNNEIKNFEKTYLLSDTEVDYLLNDNVRIDRTTNYILNGYCQRPNIIKHIANYFLNNGRGWDENELCKSVISNNKYKCRYEKNNDVFISIRAGDVFSKHDRQIIPEQRFYESIIDSLKDKYDNIYLTSDNIGHHFCQNLIKKYKITPYVTNHIDAVLFGSTCKHVIISSGSFCFLIALLSFFSDKVYFSNQAGLLIDDTNNGEKIKRWHPDYYPTLINGNKYIQNINSSSSTNVNIKEETKIPTRLHLGPIEKVYGLSINEERRKNLEKYEKLFGIDIDTSLSENAFMRAKENKSKKLDGVVPKHIRMKKRYIETNQIVKDWPSPLGAIGCTLSFSNIYKDIVANDYSYALIFEDDIDWNKEFYGECSIESFQQQLDKIDFEDDWDVFYLGTESMGDMSRQRHIKDNIFELEYGRISIPLTDRTYKSFKTSQESADPSPSIHKNFGGQQAFILSYKGAIQLLKYHDPAYVISDGILSYAISNGDIKHRSFLPTLFTQISHPRTPKLNNKLWASLTGIDKWHPMQRYSKNMCKIKKGCSGWPMSKKYGEDFHVERYKLEGDIKELNIEEAHLFNDRPLLPKY